MALVTTAIPIYQLARYCEAHGIQRLALFGSALRDDFAPDSDIDLLVCFTPDQRVGLLTMARLEREMRAFFDGRTVDLRTPDDLSPYFRDQVIADAQVLYERA